MQVAQAHACKLCDGIAFQFRRTQGQFSHRYHCRAGFLMTSSYVHGTYTGPPNILTVTKHLDGVERDLVLQVREGR